MNNLVMDCLQVFGLGIVAMSIWFILAVLAWKAAHRWLKTDKLLGIALVANMSIFILVAIVGKIVMDAYEFPKLGFERDLIVHFIMVPIFAPVLGYWAEAMMRTCIDRSDFDDGHNDVPISDQPSDPNLLQSASEPTEAVNESGATGNESTNATSQQIVKSLQLAMCV